MRFWRRKPAEAQPATEAAPPAPAEPTAEERAELHEQTGRAVERTRRGIFGRLTALFEKADFDETIWDELEEILIGADAGLETTTAILDRVRQRVKKEGVKQSARVREILREELIATLREPGETVPAWSRPDAPSPLVILVVGVNGAGKTTTIAKMAHAFKRDGATVILGAADTFRAAATDQLKVWGERVGVRVVAHQPGADPGAVAFDTLAAAESSRADIVIIDTAGRLHTKSNLMEELKKIDRVIKRKDPSAPHETLLVLDATTGQNGLQQARTFTGAVGVTGIVLAKMDGTARGGVIVTVKDELGLPIKFVGTGEKPDRLAPFDAQRFAASLFADDAPG